MRLLFWRKKEQPKAVPQPSTMPRSTNRSSVSTPQKVARPAQPKVNSSNIPSKRIIDPNAMELLPLKAWCDLNLNPLAWSRIVIRMLPVFRDFNQNLSEMQKPRANTVIEYDLYLLIMATIQEIYGVEPQLKMKKTSLTA